MAECECCSGKDVRVSFCPKCKSRSVGYVFGFGNLFGVIPKMKCRDCGFDSPTFPILVASEEELKRAIEGMKAKRVVKKVVRRSGGKKVIKRAVTRNGVPSKMRTNVRVLSGKKKVVRRR